MHREVNTTRGMRNRENVCLTEEKARLTLWILLIMTYFAFVEGMGFQDDLRLEGILNGEMETVREAELVKKGLRAHSFF